MVLLKMIIKDEIGSWELIKEEKYGPKNKRQVHWRQKAALQEGDWREI